MNKWFGIGRLCGEPEMNTDKNGNTVARYRLAVNRDFKKDGQPDADFLNCVTFGKTADFVAKYLHKGSKVAVEGRIQTGSYDKDGVKHFTTDIVVERHEFCESKNAGGQDQAQLPPMEPQQNTMFPQFTAVEPEELPF